MGQVEPSDVSVARPAKVIRVDAVLLDDADGRRPDDDAVVVVVQAGVVALEEVAELRRVPLEE